MSPTAVAEPEVEVLTHSRRMVVIDAPPDTPTREPAPRYRPGAADPTDLPPGHPDWHRLDVFRQEAWDHGISFEELEGMGAGYCPMQVSMQIDALKHWLTRQPVAV